MRTASFRTLRIAPGLREAAESVQQKGEALAAFIETSVPETIACRRAALSIAAHEPGEQVLQTLCFRAWWDGAVALA